MPTRNVPLLRGTLAHIVANPKLHDQAAWGFRRTTNGAACGTSHCYAGWALALGDPSVSFDWYELLGPGYEDEAWGVTHVYVGEGESVRWLHVAEAAAELLGLTEDEADRLFEGGNSLDDLRRIVAELCDGVPA